MTIVNMSPWEDAYVKDEKKKARKKHRLQRSLSFMIPVTKSCIYKPSLSKSWVRNQRWNY